MRLELSTRTDLALRALQALSVSGVRMNRTELSAQVGTTPDFLARIMSSLVKAGWIASEVGRGGGYTTAVPIDQISMLDVIEAVEGTPEDGRCVMRGGPCQAASTCALHDAWTRARSALMSELESTPVGRA